MPIRLTIIESPFAGEVARNQLYLKRAILHSLSLNETPFASHGFFPQFLDDTDPVQRKLGISLGYRFYAFSRLVVFYLDYGISPGMQQALDYLIENHPGMKTVFRRIGTNEEPKKK